MRPGSWSQMPRQKLAVMFDRGRLVRYSLQSVPMVRTQCGQMETMLLHFVLLQRLDIAFGQLAEREIVAQTPRRIAGALFLAQDAEGRAQWRKTRTNDATISRPCGSYAPMQPSHRQYSWRAIEDRQLLLLDEFIALAGRESQRVPVAFQIQEQLGAVIVLPFAGVHRAAPETNDHGQMLDSHRALKLAGAAGGALEHGFLRRCAS